MNIYSKKEVDKALEEDEIEGLDEAFMQGFFQASWLLIMYKYGEYNNYGRIGALANAIIAFSTTIGVIGALIYQFKDVALPNLIFVINLYIISTLIFLRWLLKKWKTL